MVRHCSPQAGPCRLPFPHTARSGARAGTETHSRSPSPLNYHHVQPFRTLLLSWGKKKKKITNDKPNKPTLPPFLCLLLSRYQRPTCVRGPVAKQSPAPPASSHHLPTWKKPANPPLTTENLLLNSFLFLFYLKQNPAGAATEVKWAARPHLGGWQGRSPADRQL